MLVDDEDDIRQAVSELLEEEGYAIVTAANGREALARIAALTELPALMILDLVMPEMNG